MVGLLCKSEYNKMAQQRVASLVETTDTAVHVEAVEDGEESKATDEEGWSRRVENPTIQELVQPKLVGDGKSDTLSNKQQASCHLLQAGRL